MLAGQGSAELDAEFQNLQSGLHYTLYFLHIIPSVENAWMQISVACVIYVRDKNIILAAYFRYPNDCLSKFRSRHHTIEHICIRSYASKRTKCGFTSFPNHGALFFVFRPLDFCSTMLGGA